MNHVLYMTVYFIWWYHFKDFNPLSHLFKYLCINMSLGLHFNLHRSSCMWFESTINVNDGVYLFQNLSWQESVISFVIQIETTSFKRTKLFKRQRYQLQTIVSCGYHIQACLSAQCNIPFSDTYEFLNFITNFSLTTHLQCVVPVGIIEEYSQYFFNL